MWNIFKKRIALNEPADFDEGLNRMRNAKMVSNSLKQAKKMQKWFLGGVIKNRYENSKIRDTDLRWEMEKILASYCKENIKELENKLKSL